MSTLERQQGWLLVDHIASPGTVAVPEGKRLELDTYTCAHCNYVVVKNRDRLRPREVCRKCMAVICDPCHGLSQCTPYMAQVEAVLERAFHTSPDSPLIIPNRVLTGASGRQG